MVFLHTLEAEAADTASVFFERWGRLIQEIWSDIKSISASTVFAFVPPLTFGFILGFAVIDDWIDRPILWLPFSFCTGWVVTVTVSAIVVLLSLHVNMGGMEKLITYGGTSLVSIPALLKGIKRSQSRERGLRREIRWRRT